MSLLTCPRPGRPGRVMVMLFLIAASCRETDAPLTPTLSGAVAQPGDPSVTSVVPNRVNPGTTVDVTVHGSGFDAGSIVKLERDGIPAAAITTNATTFVSETRLVANLTIAATADTGRYDVAVTTSGGRKGVGIELLSVEYALEELQLVAGSIRSRAHAVNDRGEVVGDHCIVFCIPRAFYWSAETGLEELPVLPGYTRSSAAAINNRGQVFGVLRCLGAPECGGEFRSQNVRWEKSGGSWVLTPVEGCSTHNPTSDQSRKFPINNLDQCVGWNAAGSVVVQTLSGGTVMTEEVLPQVFPDGFQQAKGINDLAMVVGDAYGPTAEPVVWYRNSSGTWVALRLGLPIRDDRGWGFDISEPDESGRVLVSGTTEDTHHRVTQQAVRWTLEPDGNGGWRVATLELLPTAGYGSFFRGAFATAINSAGQIVGTSGGTVESGLPVLWPAAGGIQTLPTPSRGGGGQGGGGRAADINSHGLIVGAVWDDPTLGDRAAVWRLR